MAIGAAACERIAIWGAVRDGQDIIVDRVGVGLSIAGEQHPELIAFGAVWITRRRRAFAQVTE